jgi:hypothetical protein
MARAFLPIPLAAALLPAAIAIIMIVIRTVRKLETIVILRVNPNV